MSSSDPPELLKAQTICARATYFATVGKHHQMDDFDICNYDHCQCYYGAGFEEQPSIDAADLTRGEILKHGPEVCGYPVLQNLAAESWNRPMKSGGKVFIPYMVEGIDSAESEKESIKKFMLSQRWQGTEKYEWKKPQRSGSIPNRMFSVKPMKEIFLNIFFLREIYFDGKLNITQKN